MRLELSKHVNWGRHHHNGTMTLTTLLVYSCGILSHLLFSVKNMFVKILCTLKFQRFIYLALNWAFSQRS